MVRTDEDATVWIGYADFLTTLVVLFFLIAVGVSAKARPPQTGFLEGTVAERGTGRPLKDCAVRLASDEPMLTTKAGEFQTEIKDIAGQISVGLTASCTGYGDYSQIVHVRAADTTRVQVMLSQDQRIVQTSLPGDALFGQNESRLTAEGERRIIALRDSLRPESNEVVIVQGHTDDTPFPSNAGKDNWVLSGERAAAAAKVLTSDLVKIPACQVATMGFGPSRPLEVVRPTDPRDEKLRKRAKNRRIEFRKLRGADLTSGACASG